MNFASPLVYLAPDAEIDEDATVQLEAEHAAVPGAAPAAAPAMVHRVGYAATPAMRSAAPTRRIVSHQPRVDANVMHVDFSTLAQSADEVFPGDAIFCTECKACLSQTSAVKSAAEAKDELKELKDGTQASDEHKVWKCEFCARVNLIDVAPEEIPKTASRDYVLEPAPDRKTTGQGNDNAVIFCLDVSGSMGVTTAVAGSFRLKGRKAPSLDHLPPEIREEYAAFFAQQQRTATTEVSRLQCVQASIDQQLDTWAKDIPNKPVGLVTFNHEVTIFGDGTADPETVAGDKLHRQQTLSEIGERHSTIRPISQSKAGLENRLFSIEETGQTALGPALTIALNMAKGKRGSTVIVCTDGLANIGLGALDVVNEEKRAQVEAWYEEMGRFAQTHGITVNIISIEGAECRLEDLGKVAEQTGGEVTRVDPVQLTQNFATILANPIIATQVKAKIFLHKGLKFRNEDEESSVLTQSMGNVTADTQLTFEYQIRARVAEKTLPFQVQIEYTKLDGMKCLRVISAKKETTRDIEASQQNARVDILATNVARQVAKAAKKGQLTDAITRTTAYQSQLASAVRNDADREMVESLTADMRELTASLADQEAKVARTMAATPAMASPMAQSSVASRLRSDKQYTELSRMSRKTYSPSPRTMMSSAATPVMLTPAGVPTAAAPGIPLAGRAPTATATSALPPMYTPAGVAPQPPRVAPGAPLRAPAAAAAAAGGRARSRSPQPPQPTTAPRQ